MANTDEVFNYLTNKQSAKESSVKEEVIIRSPNNEESKVLLVYGHDISARDSIELLCRRLKLETFILSNVGINSDTIYKQILEAIKNTDYVIAILTHDDIGYSISSGESESLPRARQNVILELGIALGCLEREKIMVVAKSGVELPSDLGGVVRFQYSNKVSEVYLGIAEVFQRFGHNIDLNSIKNY